MRITLAELFGGGRKRSVEDGYSRALQAARVRAAYQRAYFAPALFNLVPVQTDQIGEHGRRRPLAALLQRGLAGGAHG